MVNISVAAAAAARLNKIPVMGNEQESGMKGRGRSGGGRTWELEEILSGGKQV